MHPNNMTEVFLITLLVGQRLTKIWAYVLWKKSNFADIHPVSICYNILSWRLNFINRTNGGSVMKKLFVSIVLAIAIFGAVISPVYAGGGQTQGDEGQGTVGQGDEGNGTSPGSDAQGNQT